VLARVRPQQRKEPIQFQLLVEMTGEPAPPPLPRTMQLHRIEPHLHAKTFGMVRHSPLGWKRGKLPMPPRRFEHVSSKGPVSKRPRPSAASKKGEMAERAEALLAGIYGGGHIEAGPPSNSRTPWDTSIPLSCPRRRATLRTRRCGRLGRRRRLSTSTARRGALRAAHRWASPPTRRPGRSDRGRAPAPGRRRPRWRQRYRTHGRDRGRA
jgi:hypothetical protein